MLFVGIIPAFIYSWVSNEKLSTVALSQISQGLSSRTELAAQNIDDIIAKRILSIKTLANSPVFELATESVKVGEGFLSHYLSELTTVDTAFSEFYLLERDQVKNNTYAVVESSQEHSTQNLTRELKLAGISQLSNVADKLISHMVMFISRSRRTWTIHRLSTSSQQPSTDIQSKNHNQLKNYLWSNTNSVNSITN